MITAILKSRVCETCSKETTRWSDKSDWDVCDCGGKLRNKYNESIPDGDKKEYWNMQIGPGPSKEAQQEFLRSNPGEEINERGAVKVKGYNHQKQLLKKMGMCEL